MTETGPTVVVVDYGMGNLYSVLRACELAGARSQISSSAAAVKSADALILPGVGAFGDAMTVLRTSGLADALLSAVALGKPLLGICLGVQLLMSVSYEFGKHEGLSIIPGEVVRFATTDEKGNRLKVPNVGWRQIVKSTAAKLEASPLSAISDGEYMYFVHSYYVRPKHPRVVLATSEYGGTEFCSSLQCARVFGCQFHPERSGPAGVAIYRRWLDLALNRDLIQTGEIS